ncbi:MAG: hypothetical protein HZA36_02510 [Parcubacteria group bacterium]|nr:hypothetical protein [Parcubacteria group bacterium]
MKRTIVGFLILFTMCMVSAYAQSGEYQYRKISSLVIINHVGHAIGLYINHEFVDYVSPRERFVYNFAVFPGEVFPAEIHATLNEQSSEIFMRVIRYSKNPTSLVFTKKSFDKERTWIDPHKKVSVVIANETAHSLEILYEGKLLGVCASSATKSFSVLPGIMLIRSIRTDHSKFIAREITFPCTFIIKDSDFWIP